MISNQTSIVEFAQEIQRREDAKKDYVAHTTKLSAHEIGSDVLLDVQNGENHIYPVSHHAQRQMSARVGIPANYYDKMADVPGLRSHNLNAWFNAKPENRMVRTLDGNVRAFLSDKFRPFDNYMVVNSFLPVISEMDIKVQTQALTEKRMYLQLMFPDLQAKVVGDVHAAGLIITNSEVGAGAVDIKQMIWNLTCTNGQIHGSLFRRHHVGRRIGESEEEYSIYQDDTIAADVKAFELKLRDTIKHALSEESFLERVYKYRQAGDDKIAVFDVPKVVEVVTKQAPDLNDTDGKIILQNIQDTGNYSRYGIAAGITYLAQQIQDRDRSYELEKQGAKIIDMDSEEFAKNFKPSKN